MKRFIPIFTLLAVLAFVSGAWGAGVGQMPIKVYKLYMDPSLDSGVSTATSGTSILYIEGIKPNLPTRVSGTTIINVPREFMGTLCAFGISEVSPANSVLTRGSGNYSGVTFDVVVESIMDNSFETEKWAAAEDFPIFKGMAFSGNTRRMRSFYLPGGTHSRFSLKTGSTPFGRFEATLMIGLDAAQWPAPKPILISTHYHKFSADSGTSPMWTGATAYTVPDGTVCVEVQPDGDGVHFTADGTTTPDASNFIGFEIEDAAVWQLPPDDFRRFWYEPNGNANGGIKFKSWANRCPGQ